MDVQLNPEMQARLDHLSSETGRPQEEFVREALSEYLDDLSAMRETLQSRYDNLESGRVKPVSRAEFIERLRAQSAAIRQAQRIGRHEQLRPAPPSVG